jgi:hypothetical protein
VPCVGIYGDYNMPKWWHPVGEGHRILHEMGGLGAIEPAQVQAAVEEVLRTARRETPRRSHATG